MESLQQIVEKLLSKSAILSENLLLQLLQSLPKEWGAGSVSTLPKDFIQKLLTEVWPIGNCYYFSLIHVITPCLNSFPIFKLPFFLIFLIGFVLGLNFDRISNSSRRESC